ncbi:phosphoglycolate phosphatase [Galdieria sulphuraria]|uniref:Phosphoglycolate phosphatase n=1 Tax=Galdieria sulphuraria TaxID=130081 RepID=M2XAQ1_GALSU|nr:phosphoglycolate phosphatase [Galdieria sulphuraria]EME26962.1 phosphoglycolate phosphatase [Galdieria sulphuraria]|eukprot:XP_005703482.1 phosphoglycolate phosphatase [Galdieria sulphuraria]
MEKGLFGKAGSTTVSLIPSGERKYDAVLFDMDGVLCDSEILSRLAAATMFSQYHNVRVKPEHFAAFTGQGEERFLSGVAEMYNVPHFDPVIAKQRFFDIYISQYALSGKLHSYPGVKDLIAVCKKVGLFVAVASSADRIKVRANLLGIGLDEQIFDYIVESDQIERKKPFPDIFLQAAKGLGVNPERCVVIEDATAGIQAAKEAGMRCIAVTTSLSAEQLSSLYPDVIKEHPGLITISDILGLEEDVQ